jgi:hypothetical protein
VVERAVILTKDISIQMEHLPIEIRNESPPESTVTASFEEAVNDFKKQLILKSL